MQKPAHELKIHDVIEDEKYGKLTIFGVRRLRSRTVVFCVNETYTMFVMKEVPRTSQRTFNIIHEASEAL